eukprot:TRINITY_DN227_c0_g1_i2.p1 TRINITY_DN227_c0_g1~~TRINITY_DN227_c0_g1_i2.p1  ORF type:complete len:106 (-),score=14.25 TRINITY_DN227_c0_g1_i2:540-857(-)
MADNSNEDPDPSLRLSAERAPTDFPAVTSARLMSQNTLQFISSVPGGVFTLEQLEGALGGDKFAKRRIYDVLNVFQGIGIVARVAKGVFRYVPVVLPTPPPADQQ